MAIYEEQPDRWAAIEYTGDAAAFIADAADHTCPGSTDTYDSLTRINTDGRLDLRMGNDWVDFTWWSASQGPYVYTVLLRVSKKTEIKPVESTLASWIATGFTEIVA